MYTVIDCAASLTFCQAAQLTRNLWVKMASGTTRQDSRASNSTRSGMLFVCRPGVVHKSETSVRSGAYSRQSHIGRRKTHDTQTTAHRVRSRQYHACSASHENAARLRVPLPRTCTFLCQVSGPLLPATATSIRPGASRKAA